MKLFHTNLAPNADITPSSESSYLPASNVLNERRDKLWKTGITETEEFIVFDFGSAVEIDSFIVFDTNVFEIASEIKIQWNSSDSWGSPAGEASLSEVVSATAKDGKKAGFWIGGSSQTYRYWRFVFTKGAAEDIGAAGKVFLGLHYDTGRAPDWGSYKREWIDESVTNKALTGPGYSQERSKYRTFKMRFGKALQALKDTLHSIAQAKGTHSPFFIRVMDTAEGSTLYPMDEILYVKLNKMLGAEDSAVDNGIRWRVEPEFVEQI